MENQRRFPPQKIKRISQSDEGCKIEIKKTKTGKKIIIGRNCTRDQLKMLQETGEIDFKEDKDEKETI